MLHTEEIRISSGHLGLWLVCAFFNGEGKTLIVYWFKIANTLDFSLSLGSSLFLSFFSPLSFFLLVIYLSTSKNYFKRGAVG